jgi:hypothetical protein
MMDKPELKQVARPGSEQQRSTPPESPKRPSTASWRTISLFATPLVLGLINLVDAYADKHRAFTIADAHYAQFVGEGSESKRVAIEEGKSVGQKRKEGIVDEALKRADELLVGARGRAAQISQQGDLADPVIKRAAEATFNMMTPRHRIGENLLQITRLALLEHEGIEISINSDLLSDIKYVGRRNITYAERNEMAKRAILTAPQLVRAAVRADAGGTSSKAVATCD